MIEKNKAAHGSEAANNSALQKYINLLRAGVKVVVVQIVRSRINAKALGWLIQNGGLADV